MVLRTVGRVFIGAGCVILLFVAYQLFGTTVVADQHQLLQRAEFFQQPRQGRHGKPRPQLVPRLAGAYGRVRPPRGP